MYAPRYYSESTARAIPINNDEAYRKRVNQNRKLKKRKIRQARIKMLKAAAKYLAVKVLLMAGLLVCFMGTFAAVCGFLFVMFQPDHLVGYFLCAAGLGYMFMVMNCRLFEYIAKKLNLRFLVSEY